MRTRRIVICLVVVTLLLVSACRPVQGPTGPAVVQALPAPAATVVAPTEAAAAAPTVAAAPAPARQKIAYKVERLWVPGPALEGNLLGDATGRNALVLLPPSYADSDRRYPVVYVLHGFQGDESYGYDVLDGLQTALRDGSAQEMIVVVPNANNKLGGSWYLASPTLGNYDGYVTKDLVNLIDSTYRTLAQPQSRGISGCSMGADGAMQLALKYPSMFSVAVPVSGRYDWYDPAWLAQTVQGLTRLPANFADLAGLTLEQRVFVSAAAGVTPSPNAAPLYFDLPWVMNGGKIEVAPGFADRRAEVDAMHAAVRHVTQPVRLANILVYHAADDNTVDVRYARAFDGRLGDVGLQHTYLEVPTGGHCTMDWDPVWKFFSDNLDFGPVP